MDKSEKRYIDALRKHGYTVPEIKQKEFHLLVSSNVEAVLQPIRHDFTREEAMHYAETINTFSQKAGNGSAE